MGATSRRSFLSGAGAAAFGANLNPADSIPREKIRITDIQVTPLSYVDPRRNLWRTDRYIVWKTDAALCRVFTDQGIVGIGEGSPYAGPDRIERYTREFIRPAMVGQNPFDVDLLTCGGTDQLARCAWAGVNNACWDIIGKAKNRPVYKLLAGGAAPQPRIRIYASGGVSHEWYAGGDKALIEEAMAAREAGFTAFKFRSGTEWRYSGMTLKKYIPILRALRAAVGPSFELMHETLRAQPVTVPEVLEEFCPVLEELRIHWFEQPLRTIEEYLQVKRALPKVMVSGGESDRTRFEIEPWIARGALDIVQTDCNVTGLSENWHIARMARLRGKLLCPHNWHGGLTTMANAHLVAAIPNRHMLELNTTYNPLKEEIFQEPLRAVKGWMNLPDRPGFGMELIPGVEAKFPFAPGSYLRPNPRMEVA